MGPWGFVSLAYGIVWGVIGVYLFSLKRRYQSAQADLQALGSAEALERDAKK
jgi:CcmD family protein